MRCSMDGMDLMDRMDGPPLRRASFRLLSDLRKLTDRRQRRGSQNHENKIMKRELTNDTRRFRAKATKAAK